jgi:hypothetical protein
MLLSCGTIGGLLEPLSVIIVTLIMLATIGRTERCQDFVWTVKLTGIAAIAISAFLPTLSAPVWHVVPERANMFETLYSSYLHDLMALHRGAFRHLILTKNE